MSAADKDELNLEVRRVEREQHTLFGEPVDVSRYVVCDVATGLQVFDCSFASESEAEYHMNQLIYDYYEQMEMQDAYEYLDEDEDED